MGSLGLKISKMRPATRANLLLLKNGTRHLGLLVNPRTTERLEVTGLGKYEIIGKLRDKGYDFGPLSSKIPQWVSKYQPQEYFLYAICAVISMPFIHPDDCTCDDC